MLSKINIARLKTINHTRLLKMNQNSSGVHKKKAVPPRIIVENNRLHFIQPQNIVTMNNIDIICIHPPLLNIIHI